MKDDWANLNFYKQANSSLAPVKGNEKRVVFMGNSITHGWSDKSPEFFSKNSYVNRGIGGQTTPQMVLRFKQDVVALDPALVVILAGTNDIAGNTGPATLDEIFTNIISMVELAQANDIAVVLCALVPANVYRWAPAIKPADKIITLNKRLHAYADEHHVAFVDYYTSMVDADKGLKVAYSADGVHPNKEGYAVMEPLVQAQIAKVLKAMK